MEKRDETHVEQHGDGDVNVTAPEPPAPEPSAPAEGGDAPAESGDDE